MRNLVFIIWVILVFGANSLSFAGPYEDGLEALSKKNYHVAIDHFHKGARDLDPKSMFELLCLHSLGRVFDEFFSDDLVSLYEKAEQTGDPLAQNNLGYVRLYGLGGNIDLQEAKRLFLLAADQSNAPAQTNLGSMYENGLGVDADYREAQRWYSLAAAQRFAIAQNALGKLIISQKGDPDYPDYEEARRLFRLAADQGYAPAQNNLATMIRDELGNPSDEPEDYMEAIRLYQLAVEQGDSDAKRNLSELFKTLQRKHIHFKEIHIKKGDQCPICWEPFLGGTGAIQFLPCSHGYHAHCLQRWKDRKARDVFYGELSNRVVSPPSCPECRTLLPNEMANEMANEMEGSPARSCCSLCSIL